MSDLFYRPADGVAADFIPFWWNGDYHLFYLKDYRDEPGHGQGTPWFHLVTRDFVKFDDWGEALPRGPKDSQDVWVFTGSAIEHRGTFHIFYTGHNSNFYNTPKPVQAVMHAISSDLRAWKKDEGVALFAPQPGYEKDDWRDPFVFWNPELDEFSMLLAARRPRGPSRNRGCVAMMGSKDLRQWELREPFWAPDEYFTHECPDLFRIGDWWYLIFSEFSDRCQTRYRMSRSLKGPWIAPPDDCFDGRAYYAAKTASDGKRRFIFGWLPTRKGEKDDGTWEWGGELVVHEVMQRSDGTLRVRAPETMLGRFNRSELLSGKPRIGEWTVDGNRASTNSVGRFSALTLVKMPDPCLIEAHVKFSESTASCGLLLRADDAFDRHVQVRLEPARERVVIDRYPRPGDQPFMLERPLAMKPGKPVSLKVIADGTCLVVYANDETALSCRMYEHALGDFGCFVAEGEVAFENLSVKSISPA